MLWKVENISEEVNYSIKLLCSKYTNIFFYLDINNKRNYTLPWKGYKWYLLLKTYLLIKEKNADLPFLPYFLCDNISQSAIIMHSRFNDSTWSIKQANVSQFYTHITLYLMSTHFWVDILLKSTSSSQEIEALKENISAWKELNLYSI